MKATRRRNGEMMATFQVAVPMSLSDMAEMYTARWRDEAVEKATAQTKAEIVEEIRRDIECSGVQYAGYCVGDNNLYDEKDAVFAIFEKRFAKEFTY